LDVGANIGLYSVFLSDCVGPEGKVIAFEPERRNYELLCRSRDLNDAANLICVNKAVADENGFCELSVNPANWGDHWVLTTTAPEGATVQRVEQVSIDDYLDPQLDERVAVVKIDVQGNEHSVLKGMRRLLEKNQNLVMAIEISPTHLRNSGTSATAVMDYLKSEGFKGWDVQMNRITPLGPSWAYELFRQNYWADLIVSRNLGLLRTMFVPEYGPLADLASTPPG
jgi:FkbM family methyltransferase